MLLRQRSGGDVMIFLRRMRMFFLFSDWHCMDKRRPDFHEPCDVICIKYDWYTEVGVMYESSIVPNVSYQGFVGLYGLFVSEHKYTYWRHADRLNPQVETQVIGRINYIDPLRSNFEIRWGR